MDLQTIYALRKAMPGVFEGLTNLLAEKQMDEEAKLIQEIKSDPVASIGTVNKYFNRWREAETPREKQEILDEAMALARDPEKKLLLYKIKKWNEYIAPKKELAETYKERAAPIAREFEARGLVQPGYEYWTGTKEETRTTLGGRKEKVEVPYREPFEREGYTPDEVKLIKQALSYTEPTRERFFDTLAFKDPALAWRIRKAVEDYYARGREKPEVEKSTFGAPSPLRATEGEIPRFAADRYYVRYKVAGEEREREFKNKADAEEFARRVKGEVISPPLPEWQLPYKPLGERLQEEYRELEEMDISKVKPTEEARNIYRNMRFLRSRRALQTYFDWVKDRVSKENQAWLYQKMLSDYWFDLPEESGGDMDDIAALLPERERETFKRTIRTMEGVKPITREQVISVIADVLQGLSAPKMEGEENLPGWLAPVWKMKDVIQGIVSAIHPQRQPLLYQFAQDATRKAAEWKADGWTDKEIADALMDWAEMFYGVEPAY